MDKPEVMKDPMLVQVRMPKDLRGRIDAEVKKLNFPGERSGFIREACEEKLARSVEVKLSNGSKPKRKPASKKPTSGTRSVSSAGAEVTPRFK